MGISGFGDIKPVEGRRRLIVAVDGKERAGKTTFGMTAPSPIAYFPLDPGREGVVDKFLKEKKILAPLKENGEIETFDMMDATSQVEWDRLWEKFKKLFLLALKSKEVRSVVVDTATEMWELIRLARFGKLTQVMPHHYGPINAEFRNMIKEAYKTDKNVILLHKVKAEYINDKRTGEVERSGFSDMGYLVQLNVRVWWDQDRGFGLMVRDCRQNMGVAGMTLEEPMNTFGFLASQVFPETEESEWE